MQIRALFLLALTLPTSLLAQNQAPAPNADTPRIRELTQRIAAAPNDAWLVEERGHAYALLGQEALALADLNQAAALAPQDERMMRHIGWTLFNLREYPNALQFWLRSGAIAGYTQSWHNYTVAL